jgi:RHS repeat-associated protein
LILWCLSYGTTANYAYDAAGRRVQQTVGISVTNYLWDEASTSGDVVQETDGNGVTQASYVLGDDEVLAQTRSGTVSYDLSDGQNNVRLLTDANGAITDRYTYDAYGNLLSSQGTTVNPYRYTGQQLDSLTGLYDLRARYYDPTSGRFLSRDTAGIDVSNPVEVNRYSYAEENPVNLTDPSGHAAAQEEEEILDAVVAAAEPLAPSPPPPAPWLEKVLGLAVILAWIIGQLRQAFSGGPGAGPLPVGTGTGTGTGTAPTPAPGGSSGGGTPPPPVASPSSPCEDNPHPGGSGPTAAAREQYVFANLESLIGSANAAGKKLNQRCRDAGNKWRQIDILTNNSMIEVGGPGKFFEWGDLQTQLGNIQSAARANGFANVYFAFDTSGGASIPANILTWLADRTISIIYFSLSP